MSWLRSLSEKFKKEDREEPEETTQDVESPPKPPESPDTKPQQAFPVNSSGDSGLSADAPLSPTSRKKSAKKASPVQAIGNAVYGLQIPINPRSEQLTKKKENNKLLGFVADTVFGTKTVVDAAKIREAEERLERKMHGVVEPESESVGRMSVAESGYGDDGNLSMIMIEEQKELRRQRMVELRKKRETRCGRFMRIWCGAGGEPFFLVRLITKCPCLVVLLTTIVPFLLFLLANPLLFPFGLDLGGQGFVASSHVIVENQDAFDLALSEITNPTTSTDQQSNLIGAWQIMFEHTGGGNLLTEENVKFMREVELKIKGLGDYSSYCLSNTTSSTFSCFPPESTTNYVYNSASTIYDGLGENYLNTGQTLSEAITTIENQNKSTDFYGSKYTDGVQTTQFAVETFYWGQPLEGYSSGQDRKSEQFTKIVNQALDYLSALSGASSGDIDILYGGYGIESAVFQETIVKDLIFAFFALFSVFIYIWFHMKSFFLALLGIVQVLLSFPLCYFVYRIVFQYKFLSVFSFLSVFIIFGVGADDLFIFKDAWMQSAAIPVLRDGPLVNRMNWVYRRAARSMLITTTTTATAFYANMISIIPVVHEFGFFMGSLIIANYLLVITLFPACVVLYEKYLRRFSKYHISCVPVWLLCIPCLVIKRRKRSNTQPVVSPDNSSESGVETAVPVGDAQPEAVKVGKNEPGDIEEAEIAVDRVSVKKRGLLSRLWRILCIRDRGNPDDPEFHAWSERFFYHVYSPMLYRLRWVLFVVFIIIFAVFLGYMVQLRAQTEAESFLPSSHPLQRYYNNLKVEYSGGDYAVQVAIVWGIDTVDRSTVDQYDRTDRGVPVYKTGLTLASTDAHTYVESVCDQMKASAASLAISNSEVNCFMYDFNTWKTDNPGSVTGDFNTDIKSFTDSDPYFKQFVGYDSSNVPQWWHVSANLTLLIDDPASTLKPFYDNWEDFVTGINTNAPSTLGSAYQTSNSYVWMLTEETLQSSSMFGIILSLSLSAVVVTVTTGNVMLGIISTVVIIVIVISAIGMMVMLGWELGFTESICITILVGISVDYVLHIANAYNGSRDESRFRKMRASLTEFGQSISSAAFTTILCAFFLLFTVITFFSKFGTFLAYSIFLSAFYSFGLFPTLVSLVGPVRQQWNLRHAWWLIRYYIFNDCKCCRRKKQNDATNSAHGENDGAEVTSS